MTDLIEEAEKISENIAGGDKVAKMMWMDYYKTGREMASDLIVKRLYDRASSRMSLSRLCQYR